MGAVIATAVASVPARAQSSLPAPVDIAKSTEGQAPSQTGTAEPGATSRFLRDVGSDYKNFFSVETAWWLGVGGGAALAVHPADEALRDDTQGPDGPSSDLKGGAQYGQDYVQLPIAVAWWAIGHAAGSERGAAAGRDLLRAQINAASWTYALKYAVSRTRPNGDPRSFPSGHASSTFATAMVIQEHYGWKLGVPFFAAAAYTATSRITDNKHWASDVVFGAFIGMASARTVTVRLRGKTTSIAPWSAPGAAGVLFTVWAPFE
jgi:hypothetical protein